MPPQSRFQRLKNRIYCAIKYNRNHEPPPPYVEKLLAGTESTVEKDLESENCPDGENGVKEKKRQQAIDELRNLIRYKLMRRYLLIASPTVLFSLEDHPLKLSLELTMFTHILQLPCGPICPNF